MNKHVLLDFSEEFVSLVRIVGSQICQDKCGPRVKVAYIDCLKAIIIQSAGDLKSPERGNQLSAIIEGSSTCQIFVELK